MFKKIAKKIYFSSRKYFKDENLQNFNLFSKNKPGLMGEISQKFFSRGVDLTYIKSQCYSQKGSEQINLVELSFPRMPSQDLLSLKNQFSTSGIKMEEISSIKVPWFPRTPDDLNMFGSELLELEDRKNSLSAQMTDTEYLQRKKEIGELGKNYCFKDQIPNIEYTKEENLVWKIIYKVLRKNHSAGMSQKYEKNMREIEKQFNLSDKIPQLCQLSAYLKRKTGFTLKPTPGILNQRQFLNALAFRIFCATQYIRHRSNIDHIPEPDIVHEVVGHIPMLADPQVADISQKIGLISLGASDKEIEKLGALYWFTLEFGVCKERGKNLGYGAAIASSLQELEHLKSSKAKFKKFQPFLDCQASYHIEDVQDIYRVTEYFEESLQDLQSYGHTVIKPMKIMYNEKEKKVEYDRNIEGI